jgi:hypothetical protein
LAATVSFSGSQWRVQRAVPLRAELALKFLPTHSGALFKNGADHAAVNLIDATLKADVVQQLAASRDAGIHHRVHFLVDLARQSAPLLAQARAIESYPGNGRSITRLGSLTSWNSPTTAF